MGPATVVAVASRAGSKQAGDTSAPVTPAGAGPAPDPGPPDAGAGPAAAETAASPAAPGGRVRNRMLPRTALGLATMILAASIGAAFSGVVLYSYYEYRLSKTTDRVNALINGYQKQFANAQGDLSAQEAAAKAEIANQLGPLRQLQASADTLQALVKKVSPSIFFVHTLDANGQASVGSAFVIASDANQSLLLTSYATVQAAVRKPGPDLFVRNGGVDTQVTVWTWDERYDLALIVLPRGNLPKLDPAPTTPPPAVGDRVFAMSGLGSLGGAAVQGIVTDVSSAGIQHTAAVGQAYQGGPLLNSDGQVLAIASRAYQPLNFVSDSVWFAPYLYSACDKVLICPGGTLSNLPGTQRTG